MKIILLVLSGDSDHAREIVQAYYPSSHIDLFPRIELENRGIVAGLARVRKLRPSIFVIATERLAWQRRTDTLLLMGAFTGARETILVDQHGGRITSSKRAALAKAPLRLPLEAAISAKSLLLANRELARFEAAAAASPNYRLNTHECRCADGATRFVYVRSSPGPGTQPGGAATHINGFINAARDLGAQVMIVSNDQIAGLPNSNGSFKVIPPAPIGSTRASCDLYNNQIFTAGSTAEIESQQPDFIYQRYARFSWAGVAAHLKTGRPLFLEYNGSEVWMARNWDHVGMLDTLARFERLNLSAATRIFVVSEVERRNLLRAGIDEDKVIVNPNAVDPDLFKPNIGGVEVREELGINSDEILVGFVGTFGPWHGVEVLAEAINLLSSNKRIRFLLIGSGSLRAMVEQTISTNGGRTRVIFAGAAPHDRVPVMLDACDILVSPHVRLKDGSEFFGSPTKLFEYMAMAKGIVASRLGQIAEVLSDNETALLVEPGAAQQLAQAITRLSESGDLRARLGAAARRSAIEHHTWKMNAQRVLNEYQALARAN